MKQFQPSGLIDVWHLQEFDWTLEKVTVIVVVVVNEFVGHTFLGFRLNWNQTKQ